MRTGQNVVTAVITEIQFVHTTTEKHPHTHKEREEQAIILYQSIHANLSQIFGKPKFIIVQGRMPHICSITNVTLALETVLGLFNVLCLLELFKKKHSLYASTPFVKRHQNDCKVIEKQDLCFTSHSNKPSMYCTWRSCVFPYCFL